MAFGMLFMKMGLREGPSHDGFACVLPRIVRSPAEDVHYVCLPCNMDVQLAAERADPDERRFAEGNHGV
jgi:hypothetical protein